MIGSTILAIPGAVAFAYSGAKKVLAGQPGAVEDFTHAAVCAHTVASGFQRGTIEPLRTSVATAQDRFNRETIEPLKDHMARGIVDVTCNTIHAAGAAVRFSEKTAEQFRDGTIGRASRLADKTQRSVNRYTGSLFLSAALLMNVARHAANPDL